jgi:hypothetical protein
MKRLPTFLLLVLSICAANVSAQEASDIFESLKTRSARSGTVVINQPDELKAMVGVRMSGDNVEKTDSVAYLKINGYRTQVFSGNNQRSSKDEAFRKEREIKEVFPELPTYVTYNAPFWRLRVGDFRSHEEAYHTQRLLMEAFPAYKKEMYIVKEEVKIPLD